MSGFEAGVEVQLSQTMKNKTGKKKLEIKAAMLVRYQSGSTETPDRTSLGSFSEFIKGKS